MADASLDLITVAFGFRNLANYEAGLDEMRRVLRPGGMAAILEFSKPSNAAFAALYGFYSRRILPGSAARSPARRTPIATCRNRCGKFPAAKELAEEMRHRGFASVSYETLTGGIVALHIGEK